MEIYGIVLTFPAAFAIVAIYSFVLKRIISRWRLVSNLFLMFSLFVIVLLVLESIGILIFGPLNLRTHFGSYFYAGHEILFFLSVPALANTMLLQKTFPFISRWYITALACAFFAVAVVILQYYVSESLFGIV
jgi:hypothetical protein